MTTTAYVTLLRKVPAFRSCSKAALSRLAALVDIVELPAGIVLTGDRREVRITMEPTKMAIVDRRALTTVLHLAPELRESLASDPAECVPLPDTWGTHGTDGFLPGSLADPARR
jgi:hypothetical protein